MQEKSVIRGGSEMCVKISDAALKKRHGNVFQVSLGRNVRQIIVR